MVVEISWPAVSAGCVVLTLVGKVLHGIAMAAFESRDSEIRALRTKLETDIAAVKTTQKLQFDKYDAVARELQEYKLHVAETYVNQAALQKMLDPIDRRLENIEKEMRGNHHS